MIVWLNKIQWIFLTTYLMNVILLRGALLHRPLDEPPFIGVVTLLSGVVMVTPFSQSLVVTWLAVQTSDELQHNNDHYGMTLLGDFATRH